MQELSRHGTRCGVVFLLSHGLSQVHRKGDLGDEVDGMKRKRRRRLQRVPEAFERCRCAHDVHSGFVCVQRFFQFTISLWLLCFYGVSSCGNWQTCESVDVTRGLIVSGFLLLFIVRVHPFAARNSSFACWCHNTCVTLFSQVRLLYLIFTVPQLQEQIVGRSWSPPRSMRR